MILKINNSSFKKTILCLLMITLLIIMQCVFPLVEAHAVAAAAGAVVASALAALLIVIGVKILPKPNLSLQTIYSSIINAVQRGGELVYPALTSLFNNIVSSGISIGAKLSLAKMQLNAIKNELLQILSISSGLIDNATYNGGVIIEDAKIEQPIQKINYQEIVNTDDQLGNSLSIELGNGNTASISGRMTYYDSANRYFCTNYIQIRREDSIDQYKFYIDYYGYGIDGTNAGVHNEITYKQQYGYPIGVSMKDITKELIIKIVTYGNENQGSVYNDGKGNYGLKTDKTLRMEIYEGETLIGTKPLQISIRLDSGSYSTQSVRGSNNSEYKITYQELVNAQLETKAKIIPGVGKETLNTGNESIDITLPNTLTPNLQDVSADLKTNLDTLNPDIDYDTDIQTHTWDDTKSSEIPDVVDGSLDGTLPKEETGEMDLGDIKDMPDTEDLELPAIITNKFPFSIPWDIKRAIECLVSAPEVPKFILPFQIDSVGINEQVEIDLSDFEAVAAICRWFSTLSVCFGLILATRRLIGQ